MSSKREFLYWKEVKKSDGVVARFGIYKEGGSRIIVTDSGHEYRVHPSASNIDNEIRLVFGVEVLQTIRD